MKAFCGAATLASTLVLVVSCGVGALGNPPAGSPPLPVPVQRVTPTPGYSGPPPAAAALAVQRAPTPTLDAAYLEILRLQQSGASEDVLLAKVRAGSVRYDLTTTQILDLRQAGVSEAVVEAMVRSGR
jgi:hypothetical protein